jgi:hypothetical protein
VYWTDVMVENEYVVRAVNASTGVVEVTRTLAANREGVTLTGLVGSTEYLIDIEARNERGSRGRSSPLRFTTTRSPDQSFALVLQTPEPPHLGWLSYKATFGPWNNDARLKAISPLWNFPSLVALRFIRDGRPSSDCDTAGQFRRVLVGGSPLGDSDFTFLFGGSDLTHQIVLRACGEFAGLVPDDWRPYVKIDWREGP